jgi:hypothetical protein
LPLLPKYRIFAYIAKQNKIWAKFTLFKNCAKEIFLFLKKEETMFNLRMRYK